MNIRHMQSRVFSSLKYALKSILPNKLCEWLARLQNSYAIPIAFHQEQLQHIPANTIRYQAVFQPVSNAKDAASNQLFIKRLAEAIAKETNINATSSADVWSHIIPQHQEIIRLLQKDSKEASQYLD